MPSSVLDFYVALEAGDACESLAADLVETQVASNVEALDRCASLSLEMIRFVIDVARRTLQQLFKIMYYALMAGMQIVQIIVAAISDAIPWMSCTGVHPCASSHKALNSACAL